MFHVIMLTLWFYKYFEMQKLFQIESVNKLKNFMASNFTFGRKNHHTRERIFG